MQNMNHVTAQTELSETETRELIERMSSEHKTTVQDLAEAMDVDVEVVIARLNQMRAEKAPPAPPIFAEPPMVQPVYQRGFYGRPRPRRLGFILCTFVFVVALSKVMHASARPTLVNPSTVIHGR
ncbi:MAG: hypothetical protein GC165_00515 [Armatimonadetes bacterium]|nr:hypothetical protein [Armatimonadota bacterium]